MLEKFALFFKNLSDYMKSDISIFKTFKDALLLTNKNIILASPLILFVMFASLYLMITPYNTSNIAFVLLLFFAMTSAFFSGWFYTLKLAVSEDYDKEDIFDLIKQFPAGVGQHFLQYFFMIVIFFLLFTVVVIATYKTAPLLIGNIGISRPELFLAMSSPESMTELLKNLTLEQQTKLGQWNLYFIFTTTLYTFLIMLWAPELMFKQESVLKAFVFSIQKTLKKFFKSLTIFSFLMILYFIIMILSAIINLSIVQFVVTVIYFYFLLYSAMLIFLFYKREFCDNE